MDVNKNSNQLLVYRHRIRSLEPLGSLVPVLSEFDQMHRNDYRGMDNNNHRNRLFRVSAHNLDVYKHQ